MHGDGCEQRVLIEPPLACCSLKPHNNPPSLFRHFCCTLPKALRMDPEATDTVQLFAEEEEEWEEEEEEENAGELETTIPAVQLSKEERRKLKNKKKSVRRKEKAAERARENQELLAAGKITRREIAEAKFKRHLEGVVARERGILRQEAEDEIEERLRQWREDVEAGRISINRRISIEKRAKRSGAQAEHQKRRRAKRQADRRFLNYGWAAVGRAMLLGNQSAEGETLANMELCTSDDTHMEESVNSVPPVASVAPRVADVINLK